MSLTAGAPQPSLAWQFESSNVDSVTGLAPNLITTGTYAAPTGGTITTVAGQRIHTFTTVGNDSITFLVPVTIQLLVVAGGGGGGGCGTSNQTGGGGGAGELYYSASYSIAPGTYTVTVGAGGTGGVGVGTSGGTPTNGGDSIFGSIDCSGGGYGGSSGGLDNGGSGGSGGGASRTATGGPSVKTAAGFGNAGGDSAGSLAGGTAGGGGGGGAGGAGADAASPNTSRAAGGAGRSYSISGASVTYAAGGDGGARSNSSNGTSGTANRGGGGGGGDGNAVTNGGNGGSGIVVISYNAALYPAPTYVAGKYNQAINFNNTLSAAGSDPNCYATYDVTSFGLSSNSATMSLWLNSGLTYPITAGCNPYYINLQGPTYYSLQTETARRSSISFHTGSSPSSIIQTSAQTNIWNHYCAVFSNVGTTGASNTASYFYLNGSLVGSGNTISQSFATLNLGCQSAGGNGALCSIDDLRLFNTALTAEQVQSVYNEQGVPGRFVLSLPSTPSIAMTGSPLFNQLSASVVSSAVGAFSLRAVNGVTTRAVQIKRSSDSATQDFYADSLGNLLTAPVTGQLLQNWLGDASGSIVTWYDQSGAGNHATQATDANQPIIQRATKGPGYMVNFNGTSQFLTLSASYNFLNTTNLIVNVIALRTATVTGPNYIIGTNSPTASYQRFFLGFSSDTSIAMPVTGAPTGITIPAYNASNEPVTYMTGGLTPSRVLYQNDTLGGTNVDTTLLSVPSGYSYSIGYTVGAATYYYRGNLFEILIFNSALNQAQVTQVYQNQLGYTGT